MKKLFIFGDSYSDEVKYPKNDYSWIYLLRQEFDKTFKIYNESVMGTGPHYSFKKFYQYIDNETIDLYYPDNYIIFFLSGTDRINFPLGKPGDLEQIYYDFNTKLSSSFSGSNVKILNYFKNFNSEINFFFLTYHDELKFANFKNAAFLNMMSKIYSLKILVFFCGNLYPISLKYDDMRFRMTKLNDKNFKIFPKYLTEISENELTDDGKEKLANDNFNRFLKDKRINHFSPQNHKIFFELVSDFLNDAEINNNTKFVQSKLNFDDVYVSYINDTKDDKLRFIYE